MGKWGSLTSGSMEEGVMGDGVLLGRGHRVGWLWSGCVGLQQGVEVHLQCGKGGKRAGVEAVPCWRGEAEHRAEAGGRAGQGPDRGLGSASSPL